MKSHKSLVQLLSGTTLEPPSADVTQGNGPKGRSRFNSSGKNKSEGFDRSFKKTDNRDAAVSGHRPQLSPEEQQRRRGA